MKPRPLTPLLVGLLGSFHAIAAYHVERITPVMHQPTYITQAPGDPANIVYYTTRTSTTQGGFGAVNEMGTVWRYDINTRTATEILSLDHWNLTNDEGLHAIAFHPDFNNPGSNGFGKIFVSSAQIGGVALNRVDEYALLNENGTFKTPAEVLATDRLILEYPNKTQQNHTIDWIGFDPTATGSARAYLYIITGNGSFPLFSNPDDPSQDPSDLKGKMLRVDISGADDYPADSNRNYAVPPSNPIPVYNSANPGSPIDGLGEVWLTGLRNAYRASFDRATGDIYYGDVGENTREEISFIKAGSNASGPPLDFGWPAYEGTLATSAGSEPTNAYTGVTSIRPIRDYGHNVGDCAIGGYVYRGPVEELQGKYFFADFDPEAPGGFANTKIWMLEFDRNTDPNIFGGTNGTLTDITSSWESLVSDSTDMSYMGDNNYLDGLPGLDHIVSFGEDNQGNLYIVDFCYGTGFSGQYQASSGEIFLVMPDQPTLVHHAKGSELELSWIGDYKLEAQTNAPGTGLNANWADYPLGTNSPVTLLIDQLPGSVYFRLQSAP